MLQIEKREIWRKPQRNRKRALASYEFTEAVFLVFGISNFPYFFYIKQANQQ